MQKIYSKNIIISAFLDQKLRKLSNIYFFTIFLTCLGSVALAQQYPNVSGSVLMQLEVDRIISTNEKGISATNSYIYSEPKLSLNFDRNWSIKTEWRLQQNDQLTTRNEDIPERYRSFLGSKREVGLSEVGLIVEQLKINFKNDDLDFSAGKFDPTFGTAYNKAKRIGVFTAQFAEDYNLREKIGANLIASLEKMKIGVSTFFNDSTDLSKSAINNRGRAKRQDGISGNNGTLSSYAVSIEGRDPFGIKNWNYNFGYRNLSVDNFTNSAAEKGYVFGSEYLIKMSENTSLVPFVEVVKIRNFTGEKNRDALYATTAAILRYNSWTASVANLKRDISKTTTGSGSNNGRQLQLSVGYKFANNLTLDVSRADVREDGKKAAMLGAMLSYFYKF